MFTKDPHKPGTRLFLHYGDLSSGEQLTNLIYNIRPEEIYNLGAQSHVKVSFDIPEYTGDTTGLGTTRILEAVRRSGIRTRFYQAAPLRCSAVPLPPRTKRRRFGREAPMAQRSCNSYWLTVNYRQAYDLFACNGILFNHESPRRGGTFVTRKESQERSHRSCVATRRSST